MADKADKKTAREEAKRQKEIEKEAEKTRKLEAKAARKPADVAGEQKWTGESGLQASASGQPRAAAVLPDLPKTDAAMAARIAKDKRNKILLDLGILAGLALLVVVLLSAVGIVLLGFAIEIIILALAAAVMAASSFAMDSIGWERLRSVKQQRVLDKGKADLILTITSIAALFTVVIMVVIEAFALMVFMGTISEVGRAGAQFASNFILVQAVMLLVYLMALVAREGNVSTYKPTKNARLAAKILTPLAFLFIVLGVLMASGIVALGAVLPHQGVYIVTLGVLLEFMAMRIRLRLPSLWSLFIGAVEEARRPTAEVKDLLRKRAQRTYIISSIFVTISMVFAGAIATNTISLAGSGVATSLVIFYVGTALILLGLVAVRVFQGRSLEGRKGKEDDELSRMVAQKRRSPQEVIRMSVYAFTGFLAFVCAILTVLTAMNVMPWHEKFATDLFILTVVFGAGPFGYYYNTDRKRILAMDEKFPDFLRDIAESARAGMTLPRALVTAAQGTYGALTPDIRVMAAQVEWGVEFGDSLARFAARTKTPLIDRTVSLIVEAQRAGGSMVDILTAASEDAREIKQIVSERNTQMSMYNVVIYISFFVFIAVVMVLSAQFIPAFKKAVGAASGQQVGGLAFKDFDPEDFNTVFFQAALVQAIGGGLVGGVLSKGSPVAGFMHIGVMMIAAWLCFRVLVGIM
ncbi:MAG: archaeal flagellar protein FlaJ [Thermoplasmata archaeon]|jgi:flagellar protein FlaJ|nr:archaeal flagellar protein FlaJ [Thermoplasmata archaeon]